MCPLVTAMTLMRARIGVRVRNERAASLVEYALLVALIALVCFAAVVYFGGETSQTFSRVGKSVRGT